MDTVVQDLRYALRSLFRQPSFALTSILTLALGIGATTAIFTVVNAVVFKPLAVDRPDRLVAVVNQWTIATRPSLNVSAQDFDDWQAQSRSSFTIEGSTPLLPAGARSPQAILNVATPDYFRTLRVRSPAVVTSPTLIPATRRWSRS
jgi:putative ABC transport system permease protein